MLSFDQHFIQYLNRLGIHPSPTVHPFALLTELLLQHSLKIPFENLDIRLGKTPSLGYESLLQKIVTDHRGGYCYELNGLLYYLLQKQGFQVSLLSARILFGAQGMFARGHKLLLVQVNNDRWLLDVGYRNGLVKPLHFVPFVAQQQYSETFLLQQENDLYVLQKQVKGEWKDLYSFTLDEQLPVDFVPHNFYNAHSPDSIFTTMRIVSLKTKNGSISLLDNTLVELKQGERLETPVTSPEGYNHLLQEVFGIHLTMPEVSLLYAM